MGEAEDVDRAGREGTGFWSAALKGGETREVLVEPWAGGYVARVPGESPGAQGDTPRLSVVALALELRWPLEGVRAPGQTDEAGRLRELIARLVAHERTVGHAHEAVGVWDADNRDDVRLRPCARCHLFADAREAAGLPRWTAEEPDEEREPASGHPAGCGCGMPGAPA